MKLLVLLFVAAFVCLPAYSQNVRYAYALSTEGLFSNAHKVTIDTRNSIMDTIPLSAAQKIFALGAGAYYQNRIHHFEIISYRMTVIPFGGDTIRMEGRHYNLPIEMKEILKNIETNTIVYFEGILATVQEEPNVTSQLSLLKFYVK